MSEFSGISDVEYSGGSAPVGPVDALPAPLAFAQRNRLVRAGAALALVISPIAVEYEYGSNIGDSPPVCRAASAAGLARADNAIAHSGEQFAGELGRLGYTGNDKDIGGDLHYRADKAVRQRTTIESGLTFYPNAATVKGLSDVVDVPDLTLRRDFLEHLTDGYTSRFGVSFEVARKSDRAMAEHHSRPPTFSELSSLRYLSAVITDTLVGMPREYVKDVADLKKITVVTNRNRGDGWGWADPRTDTVYLNTGVDRLSEPLATGIAHLAVDALCGGYEKSKYDDAWPFSAKQTALTASVTFRNKKGYADLAAAARDPSILAEAAKKFEHARRLGSTATAVTRQAYASPQESRAQILTALLNNEEFVTAVDPDVPFVAKQGREMLGRLYDRHPAIADYAAGASHNQLQSPEIIRIEEALRRQK